MTATYPARLSQLPTPDECRTHARDRDGAIRSIHQTMHARSRAAVGMWQRGDSGLETSGPLDRMIAIQMEAYPSDWSDADKREMAEIHLFGRNDRG